mgnify:CR=1 FL=1
MESKINVTVRIKPLSEAESNLEKNHMWTLLSDNTLMNTRTKEMFSFDHVFGEKSDTIDLFNE